MTTTSYWGRRVARHAALAVASVAMVAVVYAGAPTDFTLARWTLATAYAGLALLALTLLLGPWNVLHGRANPVSSDARRDIGIWAGVLGIAHTIIGLQIHMQGRWWQYFVYGPEQPRRIPLRHDAFGIANYTGLGATLVFVLLLSISNDWSLRRLGTARWKALQRWNYAGFALVAAHAAIYQITSKRALPAIVAFVLTLGIVVVTQLAGYRRRRAVP